MKSFSLIEKAFFLKRIKPFSELDLDLLIAVAEKLYYDEYDANERVFAYGQAANRMYLIIQGSVLLTNEKMRPLATLEADSYFGDESLFNEQPRKYGAICKTDTELLTLSRSHLLSIISECPSVAIALLQSYALKMPCKRGLE